MKISEHQETGPTFQSEEACTGADAENPVSCPHCCQSGLSSNGYLQVSNGILAKE